MLALLLAERKAIGRVRGTLPIMLLDDVMSELDHDRRVALSRFLRAGTGQAVVTASELEHVPGAEGTDVVAVCVSTGGRLKAPGRLEGR